MVEKAAVLISIRGYTAAHEESEEAAAPEKKRKRAKWRPSPGTRARSRAPEGGSAVASSTPSGSGTLPNSFAPHDMALDPDDGL